MTVAYSITNLAASCTKVVGCFSRDDIVRGTRVKLANGLYGKSAQSAQSAGNQCAGCGPQISQISQILFAQPIASTAHSLGTAVGRLKPLTTFVQACSPGILRSPKLPYTCCMVIPGSPKPRYTSCMVIPGSLKPRYTSCMVSSGSPKLPYTTYRAISGSRKMPYFTHNSHKNNN